MLQDLDLSRVGSGFSDPVFQSQDTYRLILHAMAFPGRIMTGSYGLGDEIMMHQATAAVCLTLLDRETPPLAAGRGRHVFGGMAPVSLRVPFGG